MSDDARMAESGRRERRTATELDDVPRKVAGLRTAFLDRALGAVERIASTLDDNTLNDALEADSDEAVLAALGLTRANTMSKYTASTDPLAAARARGEQAKRDILASQGDMLTSAEVAVQLDCDVAEVERRRRDGLLVALPIEPGKHGFPSWQFTDTGLLPGLEPVLRSLDALDPWSRVMFLTSGDPYLDGRTPLELIQRGEIDAARRLAAAYDELVAT